GNSHSLVPFTHGDFGMISKLGDLLDKHIRRNDLLIIVDACMPAMEIYKNRPHSGHFADLFFNQIFAGAAMHTPHVEFGNHNFSSKKDISMLILTRFNCEDHEEDEDFQQGGGKLQLLPAKRDFIKISRFVHYFGKRLTG